MAVAFDSVGPTGGAGFGASTPAAFTWTHTPVGTPTVVFVQCNVAMTGSGVAPGTGTATYGGVSMTSLGQAQSNSVWTYGYIEVFALANPPSGAKTVAVTPNPNAGTIVGYVGGSVAYTGSGLTSVTAWGTPKLTNQGSSTTGSATYTGTSVNNRVVAFIGDGSGTESVTAGTKRYLNDYTVGNTATGCALCADITSSVGTTTISWSQASDYYGAITVEVLAPSALTINQTSIPAAIENQLYSTTLTASNGTAPYTWSISSGSLPAWATLNASTGVISGLAPNSTSSTSFTIKVTDNASNTATQAVTLVVNTPGVVQIGTPTATAYTTVNGSNTATNTWSTTQPRYKGDLLVMVVNAAAITSVTLPSAPGGWSTAWNIGNYTSTPNALTACFYTYASGGDTAPSISVSTSGTTRVGTQLFEFAGVNPTTAVDTSQTYASGTSSATISSWSIQTAANVATSNEYLIEAYSREQATAAAATFATTDGATLFTTSGAEASSRDHDMVATLANPTSGSKFTAAGTVTSAATSYGAGGVVVWAKDSHVDALIAPTTFSGSVSFPAPTVTTGGGTNANITTTVFNGTVSFPSVTVAENAAIIPTTFSGTVSFPSPTILATTAITTSVFSGSVSFPAPVVTEKAVITTTSFSGTVAFPSPTILANVAIAPTAFAGTVSFPSPVITVNASIVPTTFVGAVSFPSETIVAQTAIVPTTFAGSTSFPAPTVTTAGNASIAPTTFAGSVSFPSETITAQTSVVPGVFSGTVSFTSPTITVNANVVPSAFITSVNFPSPVLTVSAGITTTVFSGSVGFSGVTTAANAPITTSSLFGSVVFPAPTVAVNAPITTTVFSGSVIFPSTTETVSVNIIPTVFNGSVTFPAPTVSAGGNASISPTTLTTSVSFTSPTITCSSAITTTLFGATVAFAAPTMQAVTTITPTAFSGSVAFSGPSVAVSAPITTAVLAGSVSFPAPTVVAGGNASITPTTFNGSVNFPSPMVNAVVSIAPSVFTTSVGFSAPTVTTATNASITPATFGGTVSFTTPIITAVSNASITITALFGSVVFPSPIIRTGGVPGLVEQFLTGMVTIPIYGGQTIPGNMLFSGTALQQPNEMTGITTAFFYGGTVIEKSSTMALMINLSGYENNDSTFYLQVLYSEMPLSLSGYTPKLFVKASPTATDASGTTYTVGSGLTITNLSQGMITFVLPHTAATTAGTQWWRLDVVDSNSNVTTVMFGNLYILPV